MPAICRSSAQVCAIRVARLASNCTFVPGASSAVASSALIRIGSSPEYSPGEDFELKNGCGQLCVSLKNCDQLKRMNLTLELCTRDPALLELMTGAPVYTVGQDIIGYSRRGIGATCPPSVSVEIWTKAVGIQNTCPTVVEPVGYEEAQWWRVVWPKATFTLGDVTFANEIATVTLSGFAESNPNFASGPFQDIDLTLDPTSPEHMFLDPDGPPTLGCGYTTTPVPPPE